jgi:hypothetical protein
MRGRYGAGNGRLSWVEVAVEDVWVHVGPVWPHDRPQLLVDMHLGEQLGILAKRLEHRTPELAVEIDLPLGAIVERVARRIRLAVGPSGCGPSLCSWQRRNRIEGHPRTGLLPVRRELCTMERRPLPDEPERSRRKLPSSGSSVSITI